MVTTVISSMLSAKLELVSKQLYYDGIRSYWMLDNVDCATLCLGKIDNCEGISLKRYRSYNMYCVLADARDTCYEAIH